jgi:hypothetical protein
LRTCTEPVLPAICTPATGSRATSAVPPGSFTTAHIASRTSCMPRSPTPTSGQSSGREPLSSRPPMLRVKCGSTWRPVAMRAVMVASASGVSW